PLPMVTTVTKIKTDDRCDDYDDKIDKTNVTLRKNAIVQYIKHPYFVTERMCPHHASTTFSTTNEFDAPRSKGGKGIGGFEAGLDGSHHTTTCETRIGLIRRCAGCHCFEPKYASPSKHFVDVGDSNTGRCLCLACIRTVVVTNDDIVPLWEEVINFFEGPLGLLTSEDSRGRIGGGDGVTSQDLMNIPICVVGMEVMNESVRGASGAHNYSDFVTRGLCLFEKIKPRSSAGGGRSVGVMAILCLEGLPADLTASILAHEAFHAWIKLHPNFSCTNPLPRIVEEGLAQLVAFLFLSDGLDPSEAEENIDKRGDDGREADIGNSRNSAKEKNDFSIPQEVRLRQYFKFCIESDESIYGEGFRAALRAYTDLGDIQELLYYVALNRDFPL
ncbi:hypothetical protein ACHAXA_000938, partial [Cyclostephanos tholiformis]